MRILCAVIALLAASCSDRQPAQNTTLYVGAGVADRSGSGPEFSLDPPRTPRDIDPADLVGRWSNSIAECRDAIEFRADGTFVPGDGQPNRRWSVAGFTVTTADDDAGPRRTLFEVTDMQPGEMRMTFMSGQTGRLVRC